MKASLKIASLVVLLILLLPAILHAQESDSTTGSQEVVMLTPEERAWLAEHPDITFGYTDTLEPDVIVNSDGTYYGMVNDILEALNKKLGTNISLGIYPISQLIENAQKNRIDGIINIHPEYSDSIGLLSTQAYWPAYMALFAHKGVLFDGPEDFSGKRVAVIDGVYFTKKYMEQYGKQATIVKVEDALTGLWSVDKGEVDYFLGASYNSYYISKYQIFGVFTAYVFWNVPEMFGIAVRSDWPQLVSILNKWISNFSQEEIQAIVGKWVQLPVQERTIQLTAAEQAWLAQDHTVRVRVTSAPPHIILDEDEPKGISVEYLRLISERTGINFVFTKETRAYTDAMEDLAKLQGPDLIPCTVRDPEREDVLFSKSYSSSPQVIIMQTDSVFISGIDDLRGKILAAPRGGPVSKQVSERYKEITLKLVDWERDALRIVSTGQADAYIGDLTLASYLMLESGLSNLKVAAPAPMKPMSLCFGSRHDWPELTSIIDKALDNITPGERSAIQSKYLSVHYEYGIKPGDILKWILGIGGVAVCVVLFFILWNRILNRMVKQRTLTLSESEERFRSTFEQAAVGIAHISPDGRFLRINKKFCDIVGYSREEITAKTFQDITYPEDLEADLKQTKQLLSGEIDTYSMDKRYICKDGSLVWVNLTVSLVRNEQGQPQWFVSAIKDISERKQAERKLTENEQKLSGILNSISDHISMMDKDLTIVWSNDIAKELFGPDINGKKCYSCYHGIKQPCESCLVKKTFKDGQVHSHETTVVNKKGASRVFHCASSVAEFDKNGKPKLVVEVSRDITTEKDAENKIRDSEEKYRILVEQAQDGITIVQDDKIKFVNKPLAKLQGYTVEELLETPFRQYIPKHELSKIEDIYRRRMNNKDAPSVYESVIRSKDGSLIDVEFNAGLTQYNGKPADLVIVRDITERKKAKDALIESEEKFRNLMEQSSLAIQIMRPDGHIIQVNDAYMKLWSISEETYKTIRDKYSLLKDEEAKRLGIMPLIERAFGGEAVTLPPIEYNAPDTLKAIDVKKETGRKRWIQTRLYPVKNDKGEILNVVLISEDITENKRAEEEIRGLREEYTHIARVSAMGELVASLAHELKQPLAAMRSNAQAAQRFLAFDKPDIDELHEILKDIIKDNRRADDVIKKLRSLMQKSELHITRLNINDIIQEILPLVNSYEIVRNISLELELDKNIPYVNSDRVQLLQVVLNLILNSSEALMKAGQKSGSIVIRTNQNDKDNVTVSVTDNGPGIDDIVMSRLFDSFYTTKKEGLGMGLAISQSIIDGHKGRLWAENNQDRGATFYFTIPIARENQV